MTDSMRIVLTWPPGYEDEARDFGKTYCCGRYEACEIFEAIMKAKYDGGV